MHVMNVNVAIRTAALLRFGYPGNVQPGWDSKGAPIVLWHGTPLSEAAMPTVAKQEPKSWLQKLKRLVGLRR